MYQSFLGAGLRRNRQGSLNAHQTPNCSKREGNGEGKGEGDKGERRGEKGSGKRKEGREGKGIIKVVCFYHLREI